MEHVDHVLMRSSDKAQQASLQQRRNNKNRDVACFMGTVLLQRTIIRSNVDSIAALPGLDV